MSTSVLYVMTTAVPRSDITHDAHGNLVEQTCLDEKDHPIRSTDGWAHIKWVHDDRGNAIEESYFGPTGQPEHYDEPYVKERMQIQSARQEG